MRVLVEVVDRALNLRGPVYAVGERLWLDTRNEQHQQVLDQGFVRPVSAGPPSAPPEVVAAALPSAPVDRMVKAPIAAKGKRRS